MERKELDPLERLGYKRDSKYESKYKNLTVYRKWRNRIIFNQSFTVAYQLKGNRHVNIGNAESEASGEIMRNKEKNNGKNSERNV